MRTSGGRDCPEVVGQVNRVQNVRSGTFPQRSKENMGMNAIASGIDWPMPERVDEEKCPPPLFDERSTLALERRSACLPPGRMPDSTGTTLPGPGRLAGTGSPTLMQLVVWSRRYEIPGIVFVLKQSPCQGFDIYADSLTSVWLVNSLGVRLPSWLRRPVFPGRNVRVLYVAQTRQQRLPRDAYH